MPPFWLKHSRFPPVAPPTIAQPGEKSGVVGGSPKEECSNRRRFSTNLRRPFYSLCRSSAAFVLIPQALLRGLLPLAVDLHDALGTQRQIRMDKNLQAVRRVLQNVVRTAAHNDTGPLRQGL